MASQNIAINIGSSFNGEGMVKAAKSVNDLGQTVNRTAGGVQKMASALSVESWGSCPASSVRSRAA